MAMEKLMPHNTDAEACVLGSILIDPEAYQRIRHILRSEDFYRETHRVIFQTIADLYTTGREPDMMTLLYELERQGKLTNLGGVTVVSALPNEVPTSRNIQQYAEIVERTAALRRVVEAGMRMAQAAMEVGADVEQVTANARALIQTATQRRGSLDSVSADEALDELWNDILDGYEHGGFSGVHSGLTDLDEHVEGFGNGELTYLMGRPGSMKSALAAHFAFSVATSLRREEADARGLSAIHYDGTVEWLTFEMSRVKQVKRVVQAHADIDGRLIRRGFRLSNGDYDVNALAKTKRAIDELKYLIGRTLRVMDAPMTFPAIAEHLTRAVYERQCRFAIVDYLGLIRNDEQRKRRFEHISETSNQLKQLAMQLNIPILVLVQMNRASQNRANKRPELEDARESGDIEQDGDFVLGTYRGTLSRPKFTAEDPIYGEFLELSVLKAREGVPNVVVPVWARADTMKIADWPNAWRDKLDSYLALDSSEA